MEAGDIISGEASRPTIIFEVSTVSPTLRNPRENMSKVLFHQNQ
jgi:hypothetical protein